MSLAIGDYVYVHRVGLYGRIKDIWEREETFYNVAFPWCFTEDKDFGKTRVNLLSKREPCYRN